MANWKISSFCTIGGCVGVVRDRKKIHLTNTRDPRRFLTFDDEHWRHFIAAIKAGTFDLPEAPR